MKKRFGGAMLWAALLQSFIGIAATISISAPAHAANANWVNIGTIRYEGKDYIENKIEEDGSDKPNWHFYLDKDPDGCPDEINDLNYDPNSYNDYDSNKGLPKDTTVKLQRKVKGISGCENSGGAQELTLTNKNAAAISFGWVNKNTLRSYDGRDFYVYDEQFKVYKKQGDDGGCFDRLKVTANKTGAAIIVSNPIRSTDSASNDAHYRDRLRNSYESYSFVETIDYDGKEGKGDLCIFSDTENSGEAKVRVALGDMQNANKEPSPDDPTPSDSGDEGVSDACSKIGGFAYIFCPFVQGVDQLIHQAFDCNDDPPGFACSLLITQPLNSPEMQAVWKAFRTVTNIVFFLIFLIAVFANTLSIDIDAYTIKRILPRLVAAVLLVQFSYIICSLIVDFGNVLGSGIPGIVQIAGHKDISNVANVATGIAGISLMIGAGFVISALSAWLLLVPIAISLLISVLAVIFTLALRHFLIQVLVAVSPLAFAAWVLPNTEKYFKMWMSNFVKMVLMYPLIILLMTFAFIVSKVETSLTSLLAPIIVFMMIPATFKASGTLMAATSNAIRGRAKGYQSAVKGSQWRKNLKEDQRLKLATTEGRGGLKGYMAGAAQGRIFGTKSAADKFRASRAQTGAFELMKQRMDTDGSITSSDLINFADGNFDKIEDGSTLKSIKRDDPAAIAAVHKMLAERGLWDSSKAGQLANHASLTEDQRKFMWSYVHSGSSGAKIMEQDMVLGMANKEAFDKSGVFHASELSEGARVGINSMAQKMSAQKLSVQSKEGVEHLNALVPEGMGYVSPSAIRGLTAPSIQANMSDQQRAAIYTGALAAGGELEVAAKEVFEPRFEGTKVIGASIRSKDDGTGSRPPSAGDGSGDPMDVTIRS